MATIKQLIERAVMKVGSIAYLPSLDTKDSIDIAVTSNPPTGYLIYTAPADGYFVLGGSMGATNGKVRATSGKVGSEKMFVGATCFPSGAQGGQATVYVPARKGTTITYYWSNKMTVELLKFIKSVGGGYSLLAKALKRGRLLCLRLKLCSTQLLGREANSPSQTIKNRPFVWTSHPAPENTQHLQMAGSWFAQSLQRNSLLLSDSFSFINLLKRLKISHSLFRYVKDKAQAYLGGLSTKAIGVGGIFAPAVSANFEGDCYGIA